MSNMPRCYSFGIKWFFAAILVVAVGLAMIRHEIHGRLVLESDLGLNCGPSVEPVVEIGKAVDLDELRRRILAEQRRNSEETGLEPVAVYVNVVTLPDKRLMKYSFDAWVRQRLDLWHWKYVEDYSDPIVAARNEAVIAMIKRIAGDSCGLGQP